MPVADWAQPWSTSTIGAFAGSPDGTYVNIWRFPGFDPKPVTCVSACCATLTVSGEGPSSGAQDAQAIRIVASGIRYALLMGTFLNSGGGLRSSNLRAGDVTSHQRRSCPTPRGPPR